MSNRRDDRSWLDRSLSVIAETRSGEAPTAILLTLNVLLLLTAYYIIKPVREELILASPGGAEFKAWAGAGSALMLLVAVPIYGGLVSRMARNRLIMAVTFFFMACMGGFWAAGNMDTLRGSLGVPFYLWVSVFNMMVIAQFWGFANDVYTEEQGKRLFAIVGLGASSGAVIGSKLTSLLLKPPPWAPWDKLGVFSLLLVSGALLGVTALITQVVHRRESERTKPAAATTTDEDKAPPKNPFGMVFSNRYLTLLAAFSLLFTFVNTNGEYILSKLVMQAYAALPEGDKDGWIGAFYGDFYFWVNLTGFVLQSLAVSRIVKYGGLRIAFMVFPVVVLISSVSVFLLPVLAVLRITKTAENSTDYSLNNTVRNMLWLPTTREMKYKAKQAVDTFMVRMGDVSSGALVFLGVTGMEAMGMAAMGVRSFVAVNIGLTLVWLVLARAIVRENRKLHDAAKHPAD